MCDKLFTLTLAGGRTAGLREGWVACGDGCEEGADAEDGMTLLVGRSKARGVECECPLNRGLGGGSMETCCVVAAGGGARPALYGGGG
jgi:hypothetical protein